jgi:hypothetical protein
MSGAYRARLGQALLVLAGCVAAFGLGRALAPAVAQAQELPTVRVEAVQASGLEAGRIVAEDREIAVIAVPAAGFTGYERALIVADRINRQVNAGARADDFVVRTERGTPVIGMVNGPSIMTVTADDARAEGVSPTDLAARWGSALRQSLGGSALDAGSATVPVASASAEWRPAERYDDKYVPILSLLEGTRLGVARVNGPRSRIALTQAVAQFSINFGNFLEIDIYVPISTREPGRSLSRVQGVGVTGLGDIRL